MNEIVYERNSESYTHPLIILFHISCRDQRPSDDTLAAVLSILHEVIKKTAPFAVSLYEVSTQGRRLQVNSISFSNLLMFLHCLSPSFRLSTFLYATFRLSPYLFVSLYLPVCLRICQSVSVLCLCIQFLCLLVCIC